MQASLITCIGLNCEPSAEAVASGQGLRINSALQSQTTDTLFTSILQQGIAVNVPLVLGGNDTPLLLNTDDAKKTGGDESVDVCSLLMQLMVMNSGGQSDGNNDGNNNSPEETVNGLLGVINEIAEMPTGAALKGLDNAASVILQNDGKASEVLGALAALKSGANMNDGQAKSNTAETKADTALTGITEALKSALNGTAENPAAAVNDDPHNTVITRGLKENPHVMLNNVGSETTGQPEDIMNSSTTADLTATKIAAAGSNTGNTADGNTTGANHDDYGFSELISSDTNKNNEAGTAENGANQVLAGTTLNSETMAEKTSAVERALNRFTDDIRSLRSGNQEIRIVLEPESLGVLIISVMKTESGISAKIKSEDKEVAAIISEHLQKLITSMQSKGITVDDVDVVYSQTEQNTSFTQHSFSQARDESSRGYTVPADKNPDADTSNNEIWQSYFGGETGGDTTVDYRV